jgi:hypothetical protein
MTHGILQARWALSATLVAVLATACSDSLSPIPSCGACSDAQVCIEACNADGTTPDNPLSVCVFPGDGGYLRRDGESRTPTWTPPRGPPRVRRCVSGNRVGRGVRDRVLQADSETGRRYQTHARQNWQLGRGTKLVYPLRSSFTPTAAA